jgi:hypothetical protein
VTSDKPEPDRPRLDIELDDSVRIMNARRSTCRGRSTGSEENARYKETSEGGPAVVLC